MNYYKNHKEKILSIIKSVLFIILIAFPFSFNDMPTSIYAAAICTSILFIRLAIQRLKPGYINGYKALHNDYELNVPKRVEVFELSNSVTMEILYEYLGVLRTMAIHPKILIIRFKQITEIKPFEAHVLDEMINRLSENGIRIYLSDVDANIENQFIKFDILRRIGEDKIFNKIDDALKCAKKYTRP